MRWPARPPGLRTHGRILSPRPGCRGERTICQLTTASHISRLIGPATVRVFLRSRASLAVLPAGHLHQCHRQLDALLPRQFGRAESALEAGEQAHAGSAYHAIQCSELIRPIQSPPTLDHRYLHEDVGWGLAPWMHLAAAAGSPAPAPR